MIAAGGKYTRPAANWRIPAWHRKAACADSADPQQFDAPEGRITDTVVAALAFTVRSYCDRCPVNEACLIEAVQDNHEGIRGGVLRLNGRSLNVAKVPSLGLAAL